MNYKRLALFLFLIVSTACLALTLTFALANPPRINQQDGRDGPVTITRPASKQDLVSPSGERILEAVEASYQFNEKELISSSCRVKNLSGKTITALGLVWTVTFSGGTTWQTEQLVDYRVHKDIADAKGGRPLTPYEEKVIPRLTKESLVEGQTIESVKAEFSFAEFENAGGVGTENSQMYKHLLLKREGAELYRRWMENVYGGNADRIHDVVAKLSGDELPRDKKLEDAQVRQGALVYKQWMLGVLRDQGSDSLQKLLKRK